jgi:hypothetical protein
MVLPSLGSKSKPSKHQAESACWLNLLFNPEDGGSMFLQNADKLLLDYKA